MSVWLSVSKETCKTWTFGPVYSLIHRVMFFLEDTKFSSLLVLVLAVGILSPSLAQRTLTNKCSHSDIGLRPLYVLVLVPFPDSRPGAGYDGGLSSLPGARVARDEINSHKNLLRGYRIELIEADAEACSHLTAPNGLTNFVKYGIVQECRPLIAVAGLPCSSHMAELSLVAAKSQSGLMQLGAGNSPIFSLQNKQFPYLWKFLGPGTVYIDAILSFMRKYKWRRIGVVYAHNSLFFSGIARYLQQSIQSQGDIELVFSKGIGNELRGIETVLKSFYTKSVTVVAVALNREKAAQFLCMAWDKGIVYPKSIFLHVRQRPLYFKRLFSSNSFGSCTPDKIINSSRGHIYLYTKQEPDNSSVIVETIGEKYASILAKYSKQIPRVEQDYFHAEHVKTTVYNLTGEANLLYDQVWALSLALNGSLPDLAARNLSLDSYTFGETQMTKVIENHLADVRFQGASGHIEFNDNLSVSTPVELFWGLEDGRDLLVATYEHQNALTFHVNISSSDLPVDHARIIYSVLPHSISVMVYVLAGAVMLFITAVLVLYLRYRHHKEIKATGPCLSLLVYAGCYLLCLAAVVETTRVAFVLTKQLFTSIVCLRVFLLINGIGLILLTTFINLLRVYQIFFSWMKDLGNVWKSCSLFFIVLALSILPNIVVVMLIIIRPPQLYIAIFSSQLGVILVYQTFQSNFRFAGMLAAYFGTFVLLILFLAFRTRKLKYPNFKDTKKVNLFVAVLAVSICLTTPLYLALRDSHDFGREWKSSLVLITGFLVLPTTCVCVLYVPKIWPVILSGCLKRKTLCISECYVHMHAIML